MGTRDRGLAGKIRAKMADERSRVRRVAWLVDIALHRQTALEAHAGRDPRFAPPHTGERVLNRVGHLAVNLARGTGRHPRHCGLGLDRLMEDATLGMMGRPRGT